MKWHLFKKDDPNTWPELDCPMVVCDKYERLNMCDWDNECKWFVSYNPETYLYYTHLDECYYAYIGYVPSGYKVFNPIVCTNKKHGYTCDEYDDGYCMYRDLHPNCKYQKEVNEYGIEVKAIWKEFEE